MVTNIEEGIPHITSEVICVNCKYRWIAVRPVGTPLVKLECPHCEERGYVIETGENILGE